MRYEIRCEATIDGDINSIWNTWTDMARLPEWDEREEVTRIDGPFAVGTTGFSKQPGPRPGSPFTITRVEPMSRWTNECPLPGGVLILDHTLTSAGDGKVRLVKTYEIRGPMAIAFRLVFARGIRKEVPGMFAALGAEATRRRTLSAQ